MEILACGDENKREADEINLTDRVIIAVLVIATYVTFYKAEISGKSLITKHSVVINRWPDFVGSIRIVGFRIIFPKPMIRLCVAHIMIGLKF